MQDSDLFTPGTADHYPDVFGLTPQAAPAGPVLELLDALPRHAVQFGHDADANRGFLRGLLSPSR